MHISARGLIEIEGKFILIHRRKEQEDGIMRDYYVLPGGKMEEGETPEETVKREVYEEVGIRVEPIRKMMDYISEYDDSIQKIYICHYVSGKIGSGKGPEFVDKKNYTGSFEIEQVPKQNLSEMNLVPEEIKDILMEDIRNQELL